MFFSVLFFGCSNFYCCLRLGLLLLAQLLLPGRKKKLSSPADYDHTVPVGGSVIYTCEDEEFRFDNNW